VFDGAEATLHSAKESTMTIENQLRREFDDYDDWDDLAKEMARESFAHAQAAARIAQNKAIS
jgi:hypothetical protein